MRFLWVGLAFTLTLVNPTIFLRDCGYDLHYNFWNGPLFMLIFSLFILTLVLHGFVFFIITKNRTYWNTRPEKVILYLVAFNWGSWFEISSIITWNFDSFSHIILFFSPYFSKGHRSCETILNCRWFLAFVMPSNYKKVWLFRLIDGNTNYAIICNTWCLGEAILVDFMKY